MSLRNFPFVHVKRPSDTINEGPVYLEVMENLSGLTWYKSQPIGKYSINAIMKKNENKNRLYKSFALIRS